MALRTIPLSPARKMEQLAGELHDVAFEMAEASRSIVRAERIIDDVERICGEARALVRGRGKA